MVSGTRISMEFYDGVRQLVAAQIGVEGFPVWIMHLLGWGVLVLLILGIIIGLTLWLQGRRIRQKAAEAGIDAPLPASGRDLRPFGISERWWVVIGAIFIGVVWLIAPIIQATVPELGIAIGLFSIITGIVWFFVVYAVVYIVREYPRRQKALEKAIRLRGVMAEPPKKSRQCAACGAPLHKDEQFCGNCGSATR